MANLCRWSVIVAIALSSTACKTPIANQAPSQPASPAPHALASAPVPEAVAPTPGPETHATKLAPAAASAVSRSITDAGNPEAHTATAATTPARPLPAAQASPYAVQQVQFHSPTPPALPESAFTGAPPELVPSAAHPSPYPHTIVAPAEQWSPPGIECPWPADEYLYDGGDRRLAAAVQPNWDVYGLDQEDTIIHYDTITGETIVQPSNRVKIYSPRFAAVRKITGAAGFQTLDHIAGAAQGTRLVQQEELRPVEHVMQPLQPGRNVGLTTTPSFRDTTRGLQTEKVQAAIRLDGDLEPYEDFLIVRRGQFDNSEKARLADSLQAAVAWTDNIAMQVMVGKDVAAVIESESAAQSTFTYEIGGKPRLRICKLASKGAAQPGDIVDFTIRFDNIGEQVVGNVTILDSLTTRLEYVEGSQACNLKSTFITQPNEGDSLVLRWEITDPLPVGHGGVIRFKCRVR